MSTTRSIIPCSFIRLHINPSTSSQTIIFNPIYHSAAISKHKNKSYFPADRRLRHISNGRRSQSDANTKMDLVVYNSVQPGAPPPSGTPSDSDSRDKGSSRKHWILGVVITAILPFLSHKWGPLFKLTKEVENAVETADDVTEAMENIAEQVEKVADEIGDELPEGGRLQKAFAYVENKAKKAARDAHSVEQFIDKVEALEEEVDSFIDEANEITKEAKDKKPST
ncbi:uncharacterized protein LOC132279250 isoform X1 [Cornus florida]|uniref:uncharacterized protein LOC132279250 isoform X1 n=1 Tax=Cornus florida TaxID=4283 RepID=UPI0028A1630D|nr:uncharacterized protein LOC132279250 isoform X1 [Cornus florida]